MTKKYEVNANGNRSYQSNSAAEVADVAVTWKRQGHEPKAYAILVGDRIETREAEITTKRATAKALHRDEWHVLSAADRLADIEARSRQTEDRLVDMGFFGN